ncbi:hypothetical protein SAMD00019534_053490 [Acytostelium subglobosum LB1]|uniref:hypothetical protein n=1 Tax=Acytostelium subglobosum LB1 TaxID=1410327 RepID=UPI000644BB0B|nr:hypothetical protein SAMD00019534_053490 [Acytostelium subglobosum LB1]GAM22174.1 hypothetical protein SAMD00019534_053490 [Acytostelium subglobosum LB1]|eukprot:XP_012755274.1 hypothetical protein SAMD00019534_053490 [Acytostelium subglobosum LB1]
MFSSVGSLSKVRIMSNKTNKDKAMGYAFVSFTDKTCCQRAVDKFANNNTRLKGSAIRVRLSESRKKLFIGNLPKDMSKSDLEDLIYKHCTGVKHIDLLLDPDNSSRNRGYMFVEFVDHYKADKARRELGSPSFKVNNCSITVNWADYVQEADNETMKQVRALYIRNLSEGRQVEELRSLFEQYGDIEKVTIPANIPGMKRRDFGFVHFERRDDAEQALAAHRSLANLLSRTRVDHIICQTCGQETTCGDTDQEDAKNYQEVPS